MRLSWLKIEKKAEEFLLRVVKDGDPTGRTLALVKEQLAGMDDKRFDLMIERIREGKEFIPLIVDNHTTRTMDMDAALELCKKYNIEIFQRIWYRHPVTGVKVLSNYKVPFLHSWFVNRSRHYTTRSLYLNPIPKSIHLLVNRLVVHLRSLNLNQLYILKERLRCFAC